MKKPVKSNKWYLLIAVICVSLNLYSQNTGVTMKNIQFIEYPDFPDGNSTWGSIGYNPVNNNVYIGVTNHRDKIGFYEYDADSDSIFLKGFIGQMAYLSDRNWQGKIHTKIVFDTLGNAYFGTDGGESRQEYLMNHPHGYAGGFIMKWNIADGSLTNFGIQFPYESIKDVDIDKSSGKIYAISYPQVHFMIFNPKTNNLKDFGRLGSDHVPRVNFTDQWGNCYYVDWRQRLVKYEKSKDKLLFAKESLPAFSGTPGTHIITGITAFAKDKINNVIYMVTYGAKVLAFYPVEEGIGRVDDLGAVYDLPDSILWQPYVPNLNIGANGKLYYFIGGHENYVKGDTSVLMEFDPQTKKKKVLMEFPTREISEVTGSDITDNDGNMYFAGRKIRPKEPDEVEGLPSIDDNVSLPFLIKFNPEKIIR